MHDASCMMHHATRNSQLATRNSQLATRRGSTDRWQRRAGGATARALEERAMNKRNDAQHATRNTVLRLVAVLVLVASAGLGLAWPGAAAPAGGPLAQKITIGPIGAIAL